MEKSKPLVSVIMPCYNHQKYVGEAIESVLNQTYDNVEFIVADNGSTDNSYEVIQRYKDRISKIIRLEENNQVYCGTLLRKMATGKYIAIMTSDDYWESNKLELQMKAFEENPEVKACTTWAIQTDEKLQPVENQALFIVENKNRYQWFKHLILNGNCLAWPSGVIETELYDRVYSKQRGYKQLGDLYFWIQLVQEEELYVVPRILMKFRWHVSDSCRNESAPTKESKVRTLNEMADIVDDVFEHADDAFFAKAFRDNFIEKDAKTHEEILCEKFFLLKVMASKSKIFEPCALRFFYSHYIECRETFEKTYHFTFQKFHEWSGTVGGGNFDLATRKLLNIIAEKDNRVAILKRLLFEKASSEAELIQIKKEVLQVFSQDKWELFTMIADCIEKAVQSMEKVDEADNTNSYENSVQLLSTIIQGMELIWNELEFIEFPMRAEDWEMYKELVDYAKNSTIELSEAILPFTKMLKEKLALYIR